MRFADELRGIKETDAQRAQHEQQESAKKQAQLSARIFRDECMRAARTSNTKCGSISTYAKYLTSKELDEHDFHDQNRDYCELICVALRNELKDDGFKSLSIHTVCVVKAREPEYSLFGKLKRKGCTAWYGIQINASW